LSATPVDVEKFSTHNPIAVEISSTAALPPTEPRIMNVQSLALSLIAMFTCGTAFAQTAPAAAMQKPTVTMQKPAITTATPATQMMQRPAVTPMTPAATMQKPVMPGKMGR
jgi:hypothetical protein